MSPTTPTTRSPAKLRSAATKAQVAHEPGFTLIEVLVAMMVLVVGLLALLGMLDVSSHTTHANRVRQQATNLARDVTEDMRSLAYTQLATPTSIATALAPMLGASQSGATLTDTHSGYAFNLTFTTCSLDDPADGYGNHNSPPASGGSWCPDVAASGTSDSNPDDYKRVSVSVTPSSVTGVARSYGVQQTVLIYARPVNGPAVSCLTQAGGTCPGQNPQISTAGTSSMTFNVTTTTPAYEIEWLVNGNPPGVQDAAGTNGTYTPSGTTSSFTWDIPTVGGDTIDGIYSITAVALDANGNSGTRLTLHVTVNEHMVLAPGFPSFPSSSFDAGYDQQIRGVDVEWVPSVDQDVLYYNVYHQISGGSAVLVCSQVSGTSCTDTSAATVAAAPSWPSTTSCQSPPQSYSTTNVYWVVGVDRDPNTGLTRESTYKSNQVDANACDHPPSAPSGLTGSLANGQVNLSWSAPASPVDPDTGDTITAWRVYRWPASQGSTPQISVSNRLQLVGAGGGSPFVTSAADASPDPGGAAQDYCVTAVDTHMNESPCSNVISQ